MKLNFLLLFLVVLGFSGMGRAQTTKPYTQLLITESQQATAEHNYVEFTNMGSETINLENFEFGYNGAWDGGTDNRFPQVGRGTTNPAFMMLPDKEL
ncbi:MAG TPA: hypothetical protein VFG54_13755, partial [Prolixibacteraceae bacterium]|nr:hypothetical protein [Prolixibacteraceae bacterium]